MMNKEEFDIALNWATGLDSLNILTDELKERLGKIDLKLEKTNEFSNNHIPMVYRIPKYNFLSQVNKLFFNNLEKLIEKQMVKKVYRYIGYVESSEDITIVCCVLLEDKFKDLPQEFLQEILHNEDPQYSYE